MAQLCGFSYNSDCILRYICVEARFITANLLEFGFGRKAEVTPIFPRPHFLMC